MRVPARWFREVVTVETYQGNAAYGDQYNPPVVVLGHIAGQRTVTAGPTSDEVVSDRQLDLPNPARLADGSGTVDTVTLLVPESRVTSGTVSAIVGQVNEHRQPSTGRVVYVTAVLR